MKIAAYSEIIYLHLLNYLSVRCQSGAMYSDTLLRCFQVLPGTEASVLVAFIRAHATRERADIRRERARRHSNRVHIEVAAVHQHIPRTVNTHCSQVARLIVFAISFINRPKMSPPASLAQGRVAIKDVLVARLGSRAVAWVVLLVCVSLMADLVQLIERDVVFSY